MKFRVLLYLACLLLVISVSPVFAGPVGLYYLTGPSNPNHSAITVVQGNSVVGSWLSHEKYEFAIAVGQDVRTAGFQLSGVGNPKGSIYGLTGNYVTGTNFTSSPTGPWEFLDSTTDGTYNYLVYQDTNPINPDTGANPNPYIGNVYRTDRNYGNMEYMFTIDGGGFGGITYDPTNNSLWVSGYQGTPNATKVRDYDLTSHHNLLSEFDTGHTWNMALALDPITQTLWLLNGAGGAWNSPQPLEQWSKNGELLSMESVTGVAMEFGGEIIGPEPASFGLIGAGVLAIFLKRRRR